MKAPVPKPSRPKPWTGDAYRALILEGMGFEAKHLRKALRRTDEALDATTPVVTVTKGETTYEQGGDADHDVRLKAADQIYGLVGIKAHKSPDASGDGQRPVSIAIVVNAGDPTQPRPPANGLAIRINGTEGNGSGSRALGPPR